MNPTSRFLIGAAVIAASALSCRADIERVVEKTFTVEPGGALQVSAAGGGVRVETAPPGGVVLLKITAKEHIRANSESEADALLANLTLAIEKNDAGVSIVSKYADQPAGLHWGSWPPVQVDFLVTAPVRYNVDIKTSGGGITVGDLDGTVLARTAGGGIKLGQISGKVYATTSGGGIRLADGGSSVHLATAGGGIYVGRAVGPADLRTSGGGILIEAAENTVSARTSGGGIRASFVGPLKGDCSLTTSGGQIKVAVPPDAGFNLEATASGGEVRTRGLAVTVPPGVMDPRRLTGMVGTGGPRLRLRANGGSVVIEAGDTKSP